VRRLIVFGAMWLCSLALAQAPETLVTDADRRRAAMMIVVVVLVGVLGTALLLWILRRKGILKEEKPLDPLGDVKDEIARRSDEMRNQ